MMAIDCLFTLDENESYSRSHKVLLIALYACNKISLNSNRQSAENQI
jgi:hypothetical protein